MARIDILLATYNGAAFLAAQLDSILGQTYANWRLIIGDDGSTDGTRELIGSYRARFPEKIVTLNDQAENMGVVRNFSRLMEHADADYVALCDQDDVWKPEKLALSLDKMRALEATHGADMPLLVFTDLSVVDQDMRVVHPSFWRYQEIRPERCNALNRLLLQNVVTGCTALMNRPLVHRSVPIPERARVHDWWVALVAAAFGHADYVAQPTVLYRQHPQSLIGAKTLALRHLPSHAIRFLRNMKKEQRKLLDVYRQADAFHATYSQIISTEHKELIQVFLKIPGENLLSRVYHAMRCRCFPVGIVRNAIFVILQRGEY